MIPNPMFIYPRAAALLRWSDKCIILVTMAEWSNATDSRSVSFGSAGSNPAPVTHNLLTAYYHYYQYKNASC